MTRMRAVVWGAVRFYRTVLIGLLAEMLMLTVLVAAPLPRAVLIINESDPSSGAPTEFSETLRAAIDQTTPHVAVYSETLDLSLFSGSRQEAILRTYLQEKYSDVQFGVVAAVGLSAFETVRRWRSELWPGVPVVFAAIDEMSAAELKLDSDTTGVVMRRTLKSMVTAARLLVPNLQGIAVLGGSLGRDAYRRQYIKELPILATEIKLTNLTGMPLADQTKKAELLPDNTAILYTSLFIDDAGTRYSSADVLAAIAKVTNQPIVVDVETLVGLGASGGFVLDNVSYGKEVAKLVQRVFDGDRVSGIPVAVSEFTRPIFDWRQLKRWGVAESKLPPDSEIRFRQLTAWGQYRWQIVWIAAALLAQSLLVSWLFFERRRRRQAELFGRQRMAELARINRHAVVGQLSASIAHEINQPLAAIVSSGDAALRWLGNKTPNIEEAVESLRRIVRDGHRAGHVVKNVRTMFKKDIAEKTLTNINDLIREVLVLVHVELENGQMEVKSVLTDGLPQVLIDQIQLQQVMLNLVRNAVEAMSLVTERPSILQVRSEAAEAGKVMISIEDSGPGIDPENMNRIFEAFFTTKATGMGMGLSICRSIVEAHGGQLTVAPGRLYGSVFKLVLPLPR
jgi:signal transduction histidine kinase